MLENSMHLQDNITMDALTTLPATSSILKAETDERDFFFFFHTSALGGMCIHP